jgi:hypothetical protein
MLLEKFQRPNMQLSPVSELLDMIEKLHRLEVRLSARSYANGVSLAA